MSILPGFDADYVARIKATHNHEETWRWVAGCDVCNPPGGEGTLGRGDDATPAEPVCLLRREAGRVAA